MVLNYQEYIKEYNQYHKYKTYDDWDEKDENTELDDYIKKVSSYLYGKHKKIDFKNNDIKEFVENCMYDGKAAYMCAYLLTDLSDKVGSKNKERYLKERPESQ